MARYFFDVYDGQSLVRDADGSECDSAETVRQKATDVMPAILRRRILKDGDRQAYTIVVRNEDDVTAYTATLTFAGFWLGVDIPPTEAPFD